MKLAENELFRRLHGKRSILLSGAGGGFDILAGLPLYFALAKSGVKVHLANMSFSHLAIASGPRLTPSVLEVRASADGPKTYFVEKYLCEWLERNGERDAHVFAFEKRGVVPTTEAYRAIANELALDALVLIDGGTDSLLSGDEAGLGTPCEDMVSIAAANAVDVKDKFLVSLGFGIDAFHGVCHAHVLESIARFARDGGYLGAFSLQHEMPEFAAYKRALDYVHEKMPEHASIVNASIVSAVEGDFGDVHRTTRTRGSELFINPLMALYLAFELDAVARNVGYLESLRNTTTMFEVSALIEAFQKSKGALKKARLMPM